MKLSTVLYDCNVVKSVDKNFHMIFCENTFKFAIPKVIAKKKKSREVQNSKRE